MVFALGGLDPQQNNGMAWRTSKCRRCHRCHSWRMMRRMYMFTPPKMWDLKVVRAPPGCPNNIAEAGLKISETKHNLTQFLHMAFSNLQISCFYHFSSGPCGWHYCQQHLSELAQQIPQFFRENFHNVTGEVSPRSIGQWRACDPIPSALPWGEAIWRIFHSNGRNFKFFVFFHIPNVTFVFLFNIFFFCCFAASQVCWSGASAPGLA